MTKPPEQVARELYIRVTGTGPNLTYAEKEEVAFIAAALTAVFTAARREAIEECAKVVEAYLHEQGLTKNGKWTADKIRILAKPGGDPKGESLRPPRVKGPARRTSKGERER
jgi:hypothetical protein